MHRKKKSSFHRQHHRNSSTILWPFKKPIISAAPHCCQPYRCGVSRKLATAVHVNKPTPKIKATGYRLTYGMDSIGE
jgi:hypothetical protein